MRRLRVDNNELLEQNAQAQMGVSESSCPRVAEEDTCAVAECGEGGECVDNWSETNCVCEAGKAGPNCEDGKWKFMNSSLSMFNL